MPRPRPQNDRRGDHRARQGPAPRLIDTRDPRVSSAQIAADRPRSAQQVEDGLRGAGARVTLEIDV